MQGEKILLELILVADYFTKLLLLGIVQVSFIAILLLVKEFSWYYVI